jgi:hypothetical protein
MVTGGTKFGKTAYLRIYETKPPSISFHMKKCATGTGILFKSSVVDLNSFFLVPIRIHKSFVDSDTDLGSQY